MAQDKVLHRGVGLEPDSLDIHLAQSLSALIVIRDLHEGLVTFDAKAGLIPGLARDWAVSEDGLTWSFHIDPDARWPANTPITAAAVVAGRQPAER